MYNYTVKLNNIKIKALHGVREIEKKNEQLFEIDIAISFDKETCDDDIDKSINYENIYSIIVDIFKNNTFDLVETLGEKIINSIYLINDVKHVSTTIRKPEVSFGDNFNCIEVSINR